MELHPIWEKGTALNPNLWYVVSALGDRPSVRVGHTATFIAGDPGTEGKVYFVAGANPDGQLSEIYVLDLETFIWDTIDADGFAARYEHVAYSPWSEPRKIYVLMGAEKTGNRNDVQVLDTVSGAWDSVTVKGVAPCARTHHATAVSDDLVFVYSGGCKGAEPVPDRLLHCFDASTHVWSAIETQQPPKPRHGHILLARKDKLYLHGGMCGTAFFDDLHVLDLETTKWTCVRQRKIFPSRRAGHGAVVVGKYAYVFGGMNNDGALADMYKLDLDSYKWQRVELGGPAPTPRLDFAMTTVRVRLPATNAETNLALAGQQAKEALEKQLQVLSIKEAQEELDDAAIPQPVPDMYPDPPQVVVVEAPGGDDYTSIDGVIPPNPTPNTECYRPATLIVIHGGMDTQGQIWDDCLVFLAE